MFLKEIQDWSWLNLMRKSGCEGNMFLETWWWGYVNSNLQKVVPQFGIAELMNYGFMADI